MAWSSEQQRRLAAEKKVIAAKMPHFQFYNPSGNTYVAGLARTNFGKQYHAKVQLTQNYPYEEPELFITSPHTLWMYGGGTINALGTTHAFHTYDNSSDGCVKICHTLDWDSSKTCLLVILKAHLWLEAYEAHLRTGRDIADFLC